MNEELLNKSNTKTSKEGGNKDRYPGRNTEKFSKQSGIRLGKLKQALMEINLARHVKGNKKGFCRSVSDKRKTKENVGLL